MANDISGLTGIKSNTSVNDDVTGTAPIKTLNRKANKKSNTRTLRRSGQAKKLKRSIKAHQPAEKKQGRTLRMTSEQKLIALRAERTEARDTRALREEALLQNLNEMERLTIKNALEILLKTESTWLVYLFKYSAARRSRELAEHYDDRERSFEPQGQAWSEIWNEPKKVYITVNKHLPIFFRKWLDIFLPKPAKA
ncbi:MAG TPA: hypothetical protein VK612_11345 [Pyrinomonadaceae bacterium]|nr:hypothetical protein [Pyrinomonadaceae bacterium]